MAAIPLLINDELACCNEPLQRASFKTPPLKRAFTGVAQAVVALLQQAHSLPTARSERTAMVMIRAVEPLTARELEVLPNDSA